MSGIVLRIFAVVALTCLVAAPAKAEESVLVYSPWTRFGLSGSSDTLFFTGRDGRTPADCKPVIAAVLQERNGEAKKTLRVTLPTYVNRSRGVRISIDQATPIERPFAQCYANGCMADYEGGSELVDQLMQGRMLVLEAFDNDNSPLRLTLPLADFATAYDGPAAEPKVFEEITREDGTRIKSEQQKRAEEARKEADRKFGCDVK